MTTPFLDINNSPKDFWTAIVRILKLLFIIMSIVLIDGFNREFSLGDSFSKLPGALYDFSVKYKEPLTTWFRATPQGEGAKDVVIPFEKKQADIHQITPGYFELKDVPLLGAYLEERLPVLVSGRRRFLGYETAYEIYFMLILFVPMGLLVTLAWNLKRLRQRWTAFEGGSLRLIDDLPIFYNLNRSRFIVTIKAYFAAIVLLIMSLVPSISMVTQQQMTRMAIKGELHVEPLGLPNLQDENLLYLVQSSHTLTWINLLEFILSIWITVYILRLLLRRKPVANPS
jgi:hypothetical protein